MTTREQLLEAALWGNDHNGAASYSMDWPQRMANLNTPFPKGLWSADCSGYFTYLYRWTDAPNPNGMPYGDGLDQYSGTLMAAGTPIPVAKAQIGDLVTWGPAPGIHVAMVIETGLDPLTSSFGIQGCPCATPVSEITAAVSPVVEFFTYSLGEEPMPPRPGSPAARARMQRPIGDWPLLVPGLPNPRPWVDYLRACSNEVVDSEGRHLLPVLPVGLGGYGADTQELVVAIKRLAHIPLDGTQGDRVCGARVFAWLGIGR